MPMTASEWLEAVTSVATAIGVAIAVWELRQSSRQARTQFEDGLNAEYRRILANVPLDALLGRPLDEPTLKASLREFHDYFDLCNEQVFLSNNRRVSPETWESWKEGIEQHLRRPAFRQAWEELEPGLNGSLTEFRRHLPVAPGPAAPQLK